MKPDIKLTAQLNIKSGLTFWEAVKFRIAGNSLTNQFLTAVTRETIKRAEAAKYEKTNEEYQNLLLHIAEQLDRWANESERFGWSRLQVQQNRALADTIRRIIGEPVTR